MNRPPSKACQSISLDDLDESEILYSQLLDADDSPRYNPAAQAAADRDNLQSAFQQLDHSLPVALNTQGNIDYVTSTLFPSPNPTCPFPPLPLPRNRAACPPGFQCNLFPEDDDLLAAIRSCQNWHRFWALC